MSARDNAAMVQLLELLECRYAIRVVWALSDGHPQTFRLLQDSVGGVTPNTLNTRLKELRAARLVEHGGDGYRLTSQGADLARRLTEGSLNTIGEAFGGRDHGTVLHACRLVKDRMEVDDSVRQIVHYIEKQLQR